MKKVRTLTDIKNDFRVDSIHSEGEEGWWCYLKAGYQWDNNEQHTIHENTIKEICNELTNNVTVWKDDPDLKVKTKIYTRRFINWSEISRSITGDRVQIRSDYKGKMYKNIADDIKEFEKKIKKRIDEFIKEAQKVK